MFSLTPTDLAKLRGVDPSLVKVIIEAAKTAKTPFRVLEGVRSAAKQAEYYRAGTSMKNGTTDKSKHQLGKAVDIVPLINGKVVTRSWTPFYPMADNVKAAAKRLGVTVTWGGDWKTFKDGPHFEVN